MYSFPFLSTLNLLVDFNSLEESLGFLSGDNTCTYTIQ